MIPKYSPGPWQMSRFVDSPRYRFESKKWKAEQDARERLIIRGPGRVGSPECNPVATVLHEEDAPLVAGAHTMREALITIANVGSGEARRIALETLHAVDNA